jgi:hypothetical protein
LDLLIERHHSSPKMSMSQTLLRQWSSILTVHGSRTEPFIIWPI